MKFDSDDKNFNRWRAAYLAMDDRARCELLAIAEGEAEAHPRPKPRPKLTLVPRRDAIDIGAAFLEG